MLIDVNRLNSLYDSSSEEEIKWFEEMIQTLLENMVTRLENIRNSLNNKDYPQLQKELHQIKGMSLNFGLVDLGARSAEAESMVKSDRIDEAIAITGHLEELWERTRKELMEAVKPAK